MPKYAKKGSGRRAPKALALRIRQAEALQLRIQGHSFEEIAAKLKLSAAGNAANDVDAVLARVSYGEQRDAAKLREEMDARYLALLKAHWPKAQTSLAACGMILDILSHLRKLWGLDLVRKAKDEEALDLIGAITAEWEPLPAATGQPDVASGPPPLPVPLDLAGWEAVAREDADLDDDEDDLPPPAQP